MRDTDRVGLSPLLPGKEMALRHSWGRQGGNWGSRFVFEVVAFLDSVCVSVVRNA